jgi:hypothetical protein
MMNENPIYRRRFIILKFNLITYIKYTPENKKINVDNMPSSDYYISWEVLTPVDRFKEIGETSGARCIQFCFIDGNVWN